MFEQVLTKYFILFLIVFSICPSAIFSSIPPVLGVLNQKGYYHTGRQYEHPKFTQSILRYNKKPINRSVFDELDTNRGFDLDSAECEKFKIWDKGEIPFYIDIPSFTDKALRDRIRWFLNEVNSITSLNFVELPRPPLNYNEERWVYFINRGSHLACHDISLQNFTTKGVQRVVLGYDCLAKSGGLAEIVLALAGVPPQHNAPNRDEYIEVLEENIIPDKKYLFRKLDNREWLFHDLVYDFKSAGHYHEHKHSANGRATLKLKEGHEQVSMGQDHGFNVFDILKINMLYSYIVNKNKTNLPACKKLFAEVQDSKSLPSALSGKLKPLLKPNKYLGVESGKETKGDTGKVETDNSDKEETAKNQKDEMNDKNLNSDKDKSSSIDSEDEETTEENTSDIETKKDTKNSTVLSESKNEIYEKARCNELTLKMSPKSLTPYKDPLSYLSDYQTGDENLQRSVRRNHPQYINFGKMADLLKKV